VTFTANQIDPKPGKRFFRSLLSLDDLALACRIA
jgi:hypothetical protein